MSDFSIAYTRWKDRVGSDRRLIAALRLADFRRSIELTGANGDYPPCDFRQGILSNRVVLVYIEIKS